jgi:ribosomal protein S18 acetylase RimI-like enzyme
MLIEQAITLRAITPMDQPFLYHLFVSTRAAEFALLAWSEAQQAAILHMQFTAQNAHYRQHYPQAEFAAILLADEPVGRLYVDRRADALHLIDIALLPAYRNHGIGSTLLQRLLDEGTCCHLPVRLHVAVDNPAQRLYRRLGFTPVGEPGVYQAMEWQPPSVRAGYTDMAERERRILLYEQAISAIYHRTQQANLISFSSPCVGMSRG